MSRAVVEGSFTRSDIGKYKLCSMGSLRASDALLERREKDLASVSPALSSFKLQVDEWVEVSQTIKYVFYDMSILRQGASSVPASHRIHSTTLRRGTMPIRPRMLPTKPMAYHSSAPP